MTPTCQSCHQSMQGADLVLRCRITGKPAESTCAKYEREPGSDDMPWFQGGWCVTTSTEGRGD